MSQNRLFTTVNICPARHLILIFIRRILPPTRTIWAFQGVSHFSNICSSKVYTKSAVDLVDQFFLKTMFWGRVWMGWHKKFHARNLPWMMPWLAFSEYLQDMATSGMYSDELTLRAVPYIFNIELSLLVAPMNYCKCTFYTRSFCRRSTISRLFWIQSDRWRWNSK